MPKVAYTEKEKQKIIERAKDFMQRKPEAPRNKVALYAGIAVTVLERWSKEHNFTIPEPITAKQRIKRSPWAKGHMV